MTPQFLNFLQGTLNSAFNSGDSTIEIAIDKKFQQDDGSFYNLTDQKTASLISALELTIKHKNNKKIELKRISTVASAGTTSDGRPIYTLTIELNGATKLEGLANSYDGTTSTTNVIANNKITNFPKNSPCIIAVNTGVLQRVLDLFTAGTTTNSATAGENLTILDSVSLHTDGTLRKYNFASFPNLVGVVNATVSSGNTATYTTYGGVSTGHTGLTIGATQFAEDTGAIAESASSTTTLLGTAETATTIRIAKSAAVSTEFSDSDFLVFDNADATKKAKLEVSGITTSTTRTLTVPDSDGTLLTSGEANAKDTTFRIQDDGDSTKQIAFQSSGITTATTRTITMPDNDVDLASASRRGTVYSTMFETAARFNTDLSSGTVTFGTSGVVLDTTATNNRTAGIYYAAGDNANNKLFTSGCDVSFDVTPSNVTIDDEGAYVGWFNGAVMSNGQLKQWVADTIATAGIGFIFQRVGGALNLYALVADGSGATATLLQTFVNGTKLSLAFSVRSSAIDFYINQALSISITTDIPASMATTNMFFHVSNQVAAGDQTTFTIHTHSLRKI